MKVCWFKAVRLRKPLSGECLPQFAHGGCEACEYYRENEPERKKSKEDEE